MYIEQEKARRTRDRRKSMIVYILQDLMQALARYLYIEQSAGCLEIPKEGAYSVYSSETT